VIEVRFRFRKTRCERRLKAAEASLIQRCMSMDESHSSVRILLSYVNCETVLMVLPAMEKDGLDWWHRVNLLPGLVSLVFFVLTVRPARSLAVAIVLRFCCKPSATTTTTTTIATTTLCLEKNTLTFFISLWKMFRFPPEMCGS